MNKVERLITRVTPDTPVKPLEGATVVFLEPGCTVVLHKKSIRMIGSDGRLECVEGCLAGKYNVNIYGLLLALQDAGAITEGEKNCFLEELRRADVEIKRKSAIRRLEEEAHSLGFRLVEED